MIYMTGFADEAATSIDDQIRATKELGWNAIESRMVDGTQIHDLSDKDFDVVAGKLDDAGVRINCFGSAIANWGKKIDVGADFYRDIEQTGRAIRRMQRLGTRMIRIMSYAMIPDRPMEDQLFSERVARLNTLVPMFLDAGIQPVHENCMNYGGQGWTFTERLLDAVPGMKLVFDTGNPVFTRDRTLPPPHPWESSYDFFRHVCDEVIYVHIKDAVVTPEGKTQYRWPGEGDGDVVKICGELVAAGYEGGISIEPHLGAVFHDKNAGQSDAEAKYAMYVEYGHRMEKILLEAGAELGPYA